MLKALSEPASERVRCGRYRRGAAVFVFVSEGVGLNARRNCSSGWKRAGGSFLQGRDCDREGVNYRGR